MEAWMQVIFAGAQALASWVSVIIATLSLCLNVLLVLGLFVGFWQLRAAQRATRGQMLLRLIDDWRNPETHKAILYLHVIRRHWKRQIPPDAKWADVVNGLARDWVQQHAGSDVGSDEERQLDLSEEWYKRRTVSQFLSRMGMLMRERYISPNDFFSVVPETGRILAVLLPIEEAIEARYSRELPIASWDRSFGKRELRALWEQYLQWYWQRGKSL